MDKQRLLFLLKKQKDRRLNELEHQELEHWYSKLNDGSMNYAEQTGTDLALKESMLRDFRQQKLGQPRTQQMVARRFSIFLRAAVVTGVCLAVLGAFFFFSNKQPKQIAGITKPLAPIQKDPEPGGNKAILTLANGIQIPLDSAVNGTLAVQGNTTITKLADGRLSYNKTGGHAGQDLYNSMSTPRGGEYQLTLPDGTQVWLNSASTIRYPAEFSGTHRKVVISGEAYFEVAHAVSASTGKKIPFEVQMPDGEQIDVLGTHFNVNAYPEEGSVKTTLLEGSVKLTKLDKSVLIAPGQQATLGEKDYQISTPDLEKVMAWKTGFFDFDNLDLPAIMRQISRWYNVDVVFDGKPHAFAFGGRIGKNLPMSSVLKMFEEYKVAFRLEGKMLHVDF